MFALIIPVALLIGATEIIINKDVVTGLNTVLNFISVAIMIRVSGTLRKDITDYLHLTVGPQVEKVERTVTRELDKWDGTTERRDCE